MNTNLAYFVFLFSISTNSIFAQSLPSSQTQDNRLQYDIKRIVPPSPDAAALGKYGDIPVSLNLGIPQISIPLYDIKGSDLTLPISLSYHGSGLRVSEIASSVGLGWVLNAGGVITRTVNGWPDEYTNGYNTVLPYYLKNIKGTRCDASYNPRVIPCEWRMQAVSGELDLEPDELNFNFNGYVGRIQINEDNEIVCFPEQGLKIEGSLDSSWTINTPDGTSYCFYALERSQFRYGSFYISSWYLTHIISGKTNEVIDFEYEANGTTFIVPFYLFSKEWFIEPKQYIDSLECFIPTRNSLKMIEESTNMVRLSKIRFSKYNLNVLLKYIDDRKDVITQKVRRLVELSILDHANNMIKSVTFNNNAYFENKNSKLDKRLKLLSVVDNLSNATYSFEYIDNNNIPAYSSPDVDHWGFFNEAYNETLIPPMSLRYRNSYESHNSFFWASKEPNPEASKSGMLSKIHFPTGGYSEFVWEPHVISKENFNEETTLHVGSVCQSGIIAMSDQELSFADYIQKSHIDDSDMPINVDFQLFVVKKGSQCSFFVDKKGLNQTGYCRAYLSKLSNKTELSTTLKILLFDFTSNKESKEIFHNDLEYLYPGTYCLFTVASRLKKELSIRVEGSYIEDVFYKFKDKEVGGLRIKEIKSHDGIDVKNDKKIFYSYKRMYFTPLSEDELGNYSRSSGKLFIDPYYSNYGYEYIDPVSKYLIITSYLVDYFGDLCKIRGSHIGYNEVTEINSDKKEGFKITEFENSEELEKRFLILKEKTYNSKFIPVKHIENKYITSSFKAISNSILQIKLDEYCTTPPSLSNYVLYSIRFKEGLSVQNSSSWYGLSERKEKIFDSTGKNFLESKSNYYYEALDREVKHVFPTKKTYLSSDGSIYTEKTLYALDFEPSNNDIKTLQNLNMTNVPIEIKLYKDANLLSSFYSQYESMSCGAVLKNIFKCDLSQVANKKGLDVYGNLASNSYYQKQVTYQREGITGNITTESFDDDVLPVSYIWGYNHAVPVVKLDNLSYLEIPKEVISEINKHVFSNSMNYSDILKDIDFIKEQLFKIHPEKRFATIYTYKALVGMTSITDPSGVTTFYTYDDAGRLKESYMLTNGIKQILQSYEYHYKDQSQ